jgi:hypothetical protein
MIVKCGGSGNGWLKGSDCTARSFVATIETCFGMWNGVVAQLVERLVRNEKVAGSNPVGSTIPARNIYLKSTRMDFAAF